jgi:hypothetical protein
MTMHLRQRLLVYGALACIALLLADRLVFGPAADALREHRRRVGALQTDVHTAHLLIDQADVWKQRMDEFRAHALPPGRSAAENDVIKTVREWADDCRLTVSAMRTRWRPEDELPCLEVHLNAVGDLEAVTRFLHTAETAQRPVRVTSVSLTSSSASRRTLSLTVDLEAVAWQGVPAPARETGGES